ncbi:Galacturonic acid kinase isoform 8 [Theobroma cacao]|uniref:Galacturonic acid kinase isoform 8 n=1 Tax=Theobroma cacao TaxID=3641 RepID=A0A061GRR0_THECC|nr:Galacturonic acid kinase isoform 8 [Theobroma cacao]
MAAMSWPTQDELDKIRGIVSEMAGKGTEDVRVVVSPYRICPLGAHIDHQGGIVSAMTINKGILLGFVPSGNTQRVIENEYLGLRNGILDQSAILLSSHGCLTYMNCKDHETEPQKGYKILLAFSGLRQALTSNPGYNSRVAECQEAAKILLHASGNGELEPFLCNVEPESYEAHKVKLEPNLARRAEHYFSENMRVSKGLEAWASGELRQFGQLMSASGLSSIKNYECGCEPLIQLYEVLLRAPGVFGARFSGAGFRGCCVALVDTDCVAEAAKFVREEYPKLQPVLASQLNPDTAVLICEAGDCARVI